MKRDMDLARAILLKLEGDQYDGNNRFYDLPAIKDYSPKQVEYNVGLLMEAGLLKARRPFDGSPLVPYKLTWDGHEFIDAAKFEGQWEKAKEIVREKGGGLAFDVVKSLLIQLAKESIGLG